MNNTNDVMINIYDTLVHLRYPHVTNVESKDLETTILDGENRISLLAWLLTEKSASIKTHLGKLKDAALEDQLYEYYSHIGICKSKKILLGKCSLKEQLPTLRLLLDFMRKVYVKPSTGTSEEEETLVDIIKLYSNNDSQDSSAVVKSKISYDDAVKYFEENKKELLNDDSKETITDLPEDLDTKTDNKLIKEDQDLLFDKEKEKFIEAFDTVSSWPVKARSLDENISNSICSNIKSICSDFSSVKKVLEAKEEISNSTLTNELSKTLAPLNSIIEDIVINVEELRNLMNTSDE
ncbi:hypothetical protein PUN28_015899 [Cardiocondyla obscurior]|uniref:Uncharacterized protein n=1 Tax=Cardiocondyla obscurior TaxID=286306 RepID=A0AAW2EQ04_9HYME